MIHRQETDYVCKCLLKFKVKDLLDLVVQCMSTVPMYSKYPGVYDSCSPPSLPLF